MAGGTFARPCLVSEMTLFSCVGRNVHVDDLPRAPSGRVRVLRQKPPPNLLTTFIDSLGIFARA